MPAVFISIYMVAMRAALAWRGAVWTFYSVFPSVRDEIFKHSMCSFSQTLLFLSSEMPEPYSSSAGALRKQMLLRGGKVANHADGVPLLSAKRRTVPGCHWK